MRIVLFRAGWGILERDRSNCRSLHGSSILRSLVGPSFPAGGVVFSIL